MSAGNWLLLSSAIIGGGGVSGFVGSLVAPLVRRPVVRAEATERLTAASVSLVEQLQEEVKAARTEAHTARMEAREAGQEASAARRTVRAMSGEMDELTSRLHRLIGWIHEPTMSLERLRVLVPGPPSANNSGQH